MNFYERPNTILSLRIAPGPVYIGIGIIHGPGQAYHLWSVLVEPFGALGART